MVKHWKIIDLNGIFFSFHCTKDEEIEEDGEREETHSDIGKITSEI